MKKICFFILLIFLCNVVKAETISVSGAGNDGDVYKFKVSIGNILNENNINIVNGTIDINSGLIKSVYLEQNSEWEVIYKLKNDKIYFITYAIGDFAVNGDDLFDVFVTLDKDLKREDIKLTINDLMTSNGDVLFKFNKLEYKFKNLDLLISTESNQVEDGKLDVWYDEVVENVDKEENFVEVPEENVNAIQVYESKSNNGIIILIGIVLFLFVVAMICVYVLYKKICGIEKRLNEDFCEEENKDTKKKRRGRKKSKNSKEVV